MRFVRLTMLIYRVTTLYRRGSSFLPQHRLHQLVHSWKPPIKQHPVQEKTILDAQRLVRGNLPQSSWAETNQGTNSREPQQRDTLGTSFSSSEPLNQLSCFRNYSLNPTKRKTQVRYSTTSECRQHQSIWALLIMLQLYRTHSIAKKETKALSKQTVVKCDYPKVVNFLQFSVPKMITFWLKAMVRAFF